MKDLLALSNKKGQVASMGPAIVGLAIAGIFLVLGIIMLGEINTTDLVQNTLSKTVTLESVTPTTAGVAVANAKLCGCKLTVNAIANGTLGPNINSGNYSVANCKIANKTGTFIDTAWRVNYTVTYGDTACTQGNATIHGLGTFADFWEIIVLAIVITIVIGLLLIVFGGRRVE